MKTKYRDGIKRRANNAETENWEFGKVEFEEKNGKQSTEFLFFLWRK